MLNEQSAGGAVAADGMLYVIGGRDGVSLCSVQRYDVATNTWTEVASMGSRRVGVGVAALEHSGPLTLHELVNAGCTASELRDGRKCTAAELRAAGFLAVDVYGAGHSLAELREAGFTAAEVRQIQAEGSPPPAQHASAATPEWLNEASRSRHRSSLRATRYYGVANLEQLNESVSSLNAIRHDGSEHVGASAS